MQGGVSSLLIDEGWSPRDVELDVREREEASEIASICGAHR